MLLLLVNGGPATRLLVGLRMYGNDFVHPDVKVALSV